MTPVAAKTLALRLHADQTDKGGRPYGEHLQAVVAILLRDHPDAPDDAIAAAWLHDAIEDTGCGRRGLAAAGVPQAAIEIVRELTRSAWLPYLDWIRLLAQRGSVWAIRIKLADNEHNSDPARALPGSNMIERRYQPAREILLDGLARHAQSPSPATWRLPA